MTYTTTQGDTWDTIAFKLYGREALLTLLIRANESHAQTVIFSAGVVLAVPEAPEEVSEDLPPWKRD